MDSSDFDRVMMRKALACAKHGDPSPNPHVGAILVKNNKVIATGFHRKAGGDHAEVVAIKKAKNKAAGATLYVSIEPCNHTGRTGPCTEAIIQAGIARVVVGCADPKPHRPGASAKLRRAGIPVTVGVEQQAAEELCADFAKHIIHGLPWVTLKAAITLDGKIADAKKQSKWITSESARKHAHRIRSQQDAVLVGIETVLRDDPALTVRLVKGRSPQPVIVDSSLRISLKSRVLQHPKPPWIFHGPEASAAKIKSLEKLGACCVAVPKNRDGGLQLHKVLKTLANRDVVRLLVEGGGRLHGSFVDKRLADRLHLYIAPKILGDTQGPSWVDCQKRIGIYQASCLNNLHWKRLDGDLLLQANFPWH